jgi:hypothetical protein
MSRSSSPDRHAHVAYIGPMALLLRGLLILLVGVAGWVLGGLVGVILGAIADAILSGAGGGSPGEAVVSHAWGWSMLGGVLGFGAGVAWMGWRLGRRRG